MFEQTTVPTNKDTSSEVTYSYSDVSAISSIYKEDNDCTVKAVVIVTGEAYPKVHELFRLAGRRARCGTTETITFKVLAQLGFKTRDLTKFYDGASVRSIAPQLPSQGNFLVFTRKHVAAIRNNEVIDHAKERKLYVKAIYEVVPLDAEVNLSPPPPPKRTVVINYTQPTKAVHAIASILMDEQGGFKSLPANGNSRRAWGAFRAKVVAECVANGINKTTASVQVDKWMKENGYYYQMMT